MDLGAPQFQGTSTSYGFLLWICQTSGMISHPSLPQLRLDRDDVHQRQFNGMNLMEHHVFPRILCITAMVPRCAKTITNHPRAYSVIIINASPADFSHKFRWWKSLSQSLLSLPNHSSAVDSALSVRFPSLWCPAPKLHQARLVSAMLPVGPNVFFWVVAL